MPFEMMMTEGSVTVLIEEVVRFLLMVEAMIIGDLQVHIVEIGVALIMAVVPTQSPDMNGEEVPSMIELKALSMGDITVVHPHHVDPIQSPHMNEGEVPSMRELKAQSMGDTTVVHPHHVVGLPHHVVGLDPEKLLLRKSIW